MNQSQRIYLDNAATSWPKPDAVYAAVDRYLRENGAPAGRSAYGEASRAERLVRDARAGVAALLDVEEPGRVIFTSNGTASLNLAIHGLLRPGDHVVTSVVEHNSVLRPLRHLEEHHGIEVTRLGCGTDGIVDPDDFQQALRSHTKLVVLVHASNVTGAIQPTAEIGKIARGRGIPFLVDAAQSLGQLPFTFADLHCDLLAAPGHKGLLGPLGTGVLVLGEGVAEKLVSTQQGGTGTKSELDRQPDDLPDKYESGNHNVPGIVGLGAGLDYLRERGVNDVRRHHVELCGRLLEGLRGLERITLYGPADPEARVGVVSLSVHGYDPQEIAATLDAGYRMGVRAGIHCAPRMHQALGTLEKGGTVRFSVGPFNTKDDIDQAIQAVTDLAAESLAL